MSSQDTLGLAAALVWRSAGSKTIKSDAREEPAATGEILTSGLPSQAY